MRIEQSGKILCQENNYNYFLTLFLFRLNNGDRWERERDGGGEELQAGADLQGHQRRQDPGLHHLAEGEQG